MIHYERVKHKLNTIITIFERFNKDSKEVPVDLFIRLLDDLSVDEFITVDGIKNSLLIIILLISFTEMFIV